MHANSATSFAMELKQNLLLVIAVVIYWSLALLDPWDLFGNARETLYLIQNAAWLAFVLIHGRRRYGWDNLFIFFGITFLISWLTETTSIATGFPFGNYHYTDRYADLLGAKIGTVPLTVMPAYFVAGYLAWTMATVFLGNLGTGIGGSFRPFFRAAARCFLALSEIARVLTSNSPNGTVCPFFAAA